jgi:hypothetical protein
MRTWEREGTEDEIEKQDEENLKLAYEAYINGDEGYSN